MRFYFRSDAVLQRRDDLTASCVVFRIRREHQYDIERQADGIAFNLHVALLHDIEQAHLDFACEIRQLINRKDSAIGTRQKPVMHAQFATDRVSPFCCFDGIDIANNVGNGNVGRGELFDIAVLLRTVIDRSAVFHFLD